MEVVSRDLTLFNVLSSQVFFGSQKLTEFHIFFKTIEFRDKSPQKRWQIVAQIFNCCFGDHLMSLVIFQKIIEVDEKHLPPLNYNEK